MRNKNRSDRSRGAVSPLLGSQANGRDWIATIPSWPEHFSYRDMVETARLLSKELRNPDGQHRVDMIIALTHCRVPNVG